MARTFELTEEQFNAALTAAAKGGAESVLKVMGGVPNQAQDMSPNQMFDATMRARRGLDEPPIAVEIVDNCKSHVSNATFRAKVVRGIVTELLDYKHPVGVDKHIADGGLVTDRMPIQDRNGQIEPIYKQWLWENFWQLDIRTYVGRALPKYVVGEQAA